ncbi:hypothetical protein EVAR_52207_1 [Eumeta japonica]|uniref:Uncharacterized protein n=1 Tax=Eumeta variegata TaxID=151549 RepID=A0A4C1Z4J3_EUMVA|nr:hypothetical protein EVAR_52207_1 [Eumeta japonica]
MNETRSRDLNSLMNKKYVSNKSKILLVFTVSESALVYRPMYARGDREDERQAERTGAHAGRAPAAARSSPLDVSRQKRYCVERTI